MRNIINLACWSHTGYIRNNNEDNFYFDGQFLSENHGSMERPLTAEHSDDQLILAGVFDGMGGAAKGERASFIAASTAASLSGKPMPLAELACKMNCCVADEAVRTSCNMGSTAVILSFLSGSFSICNVGDSRGFLFRRSELGQLTKDHTDWDFLQKNKCIGRKPALTQYIGVPIEEFSIEPYVDEGAIQDGDRFLICSDGLTDMVSQDEIEYIISASGDPCTCVEQLLKSALKQGGRDNVTAIAAYVIAE